MFAAHAAGRFFMRLLWLCLSLIMLNATHPARAFLSNPQWNVAIVDWSDGSMVAGEDATPDDLQATWSEHEELVGSDDPPRVMIYPFEDGQGSRLGFERVGD